MNDGLSVRSESVIRCAELPVPSEILLNDFDDQKEIFQYLKDYDLTNEEKSRLADVKRILIQEKGEEEYYTQYNKRMRVL